VWLCFKSCVCCCDEQGHAVGLLHLIDNLNRRGLSVVDSDQLLSKTRIALNPRTRQPYEASIRSREHQCIRYLFAVLWKFPCDLQSIVTGQLWHTSVRALCTVTKLHVHLLKNKNILVQKRLFHIGHTRISKQIHSWLCCSVGFHHMPGCACGLARGCLR
jgi:hypothetical protein